MELKGREAMVRAFSEFLKDVDTVYHCNGQSIFTVKGDAATGTCYCMITLISSHPSKKTKTTIGAVYHDHYIRQDQRWLIEKRIGDFIWQVQYEID